MRKEKVLLTHLLDYFEKTYIIHLRERKDRYRDTLKELKKQGVASDLDQVVFYSTERPTEQGDFPTLGARGSFTSHTNVMKLALEQNLDRVLVMEDDIAILNTVKTHGLEVVKHLENIPWDIVYFGYLVPKHLPPGPPLVPYHGPTQGGHFYGVNSTILPRLVDFLESCMTRPAGHPEGGPMFRDGGFNLFRTLNPDVKIYLASPNLARQRSSRTDLHRLNWYDQLSITRPLVDQFRSFKNRLLPQV